MTAQSEMIKTYLSIHNYAVTSTPSSVIYFGGYHNEEAKTSDKVVEFKNLKWSLLGNLLSPRSSPCSIKIENKIYLFGGFDTT